MSHYEAIAVSQPAQGVGLIQLNRPRALNALNSRMFAEIISAAKEFDADKSIGAIVVAGSEKAFAGKMGHGVC